MNYIKFLAGNKRPVFFGFLTAFFSGFGQTFFISLYVPDIMKTFGLDNFSFGLLYGAATITSAVLLILTGKFIDHYNIRNYTLSAVVILAAASFIASKSDSFLFIFIGFLGLRFAGQGMLPHISQTFISKVFNTTRGTALSLSSLGYSLGEAFFPILIISLIGFLGWRGSMALNAFFILIVLVPAVFFLLNRRMINLNTVEDSSGEKEKFSRIKLLKDKKFYIIAYNAVMLPAAITGLFFYQLVLAREKGWPDELLPASFIGFAAGRTLFLLIGGRLTDKFTARKMFPLYLLPFAAGLAVLALSSAPLAAPAYLVFAGISMGLSGTVYSSMLAEVYGTENLGGVKSVFTAVMVFSTAVCPALFGFLLDNGFDFTFIISGIIFLVLTAVFLSFRLEKNRNSGY
ncbi:MAG: MFS transporter [Candidatus Goldiibacteriota bacterium]